MIVKLHKKFLKQFKKLDNSIKESFQARRDLFFQLPTHPLLNDHPLHGEYVNHRSFNVTGDYRLIYKKLNTDAVLFYAIGTHHELFGS